MSDWPLAGWLAGLWPLAGQRMYWMAGLWNLWLASGWMALWPCPGRISPLPGCVVAGPGLQKKAKNAKKAINIAKIKEK